MRIIKPSRTMERLAFVQSEYTQAKACRELGISPGRYRRLRDGVVKPSSSLNNRIYNISRKVGYRQMRAHGFSTKTAHDLQGHPEPHVSRAKTIYKQVRWENPKLTKKQARKKIEEITSRASIAPTPEAAHEIWDELRDLMYKREEEDFEDWDGPI